MRIISCFALTLLTSYSAFAATSRLTDDDLALIPQPKTIKWLSHKSVTPTDTIPRIYVTNQNSPLNSDESYTLIITSRNITINAPTQQGAIWGLQTLKQLRRSDGSYPNLRITDAPEFKLRGMMYDDGRNFIGVERIKRYIDLLSAYKLNVFQWHLTDRPAWRIESHAYPRLNDGKFQRAGRDQGCYYTYAEIRDVFTYARERGVLVIPEIDMPGHSDYFQTSFGFSMDSSEGIAVLEQCIDEFCNEIPADICPYIHIGSDEVKIADPNGFMLWAQNTIRKYGRKTIAWDPGLTADEYTIRQFWREGNNEAAPYPQDVPFIDSGMGYLNNYDPLLLPAKIFFHTMCGTGSYDSNHIGGIICLWNDVRIADKDLAAPHNGLAGNVMSFSERAWIGGIPATCNRGEHGTLLPHPDSKEMSAFEKFQCRMSDHKRRFLKTELSYWEPIHASRWSVDIASDSLSWHFDAYGDVLDLDGLCTVNNIPDNVNLTCNVSRNIESSSDTIRYYKIGFEAPSRANRKSDGIAEQGHWPNYGTITVNSVPLAPPTWKEPNTYRYHYNTWSKPEGELPYTNEQLYWMREPLAIQLHKGINTVTMTLRRHFKGQRFQVSLIEVSDYHHAL